MSIADYEWLEWVSSRSGKLTAFAVDPTSEARTGVSRALNGARVPARAVPASPKTPKDAICAELALKAPKPAPKKPAPAAAPAPALRPDVRPPLRLVGTRVEVVGVDGRVLGVFPAKRLGPGPTEVVFRGRAWAVLQAGKRRTFGLVG